MTKTFRLMAASLVLLLLAACARQGLDAGLDASKGAFMVASASKPASEAGVEILRMGGSAADAAIAVQAVLTLTEPESSGLGGGAFMLHWSQAAKKLDAYDGRETAPAGVAPDMFLGVDGKPLPFLDAMVSGRSVGVPGAVAMLALAHQEHGALPWSALFAPAIKLAREGFAISPKLAQAIATMPRLAQSPDTGSYFFAGEKPLSAGHILKNPAYAATLEKIASGGADVFYRGDIADEIVRAVKNATNRPGTLSSSDLAAYRTKNRDAICKPYRSYRICTMPPPTSGGVTTLQILGMMEAFDLARMGPMSAASIHLIAEAEKLAYADRALYLADPDAVHVPVDALLAPDYLKSRATLINPSKSMREATPGQPEGIRADGYGHNADMSLPSTTHFSIIDGKGNVVSMTSSVEGPFGSQLMAGGMILNNQLTDFSFLPERDGRKVANAIAPGKRPLSSMDPVIVFDEKGDFYAAIGSPGGTRIIGYVTQTLIALIDWKMNMQEAIDLPRFIDRNDKLEIEKDTPIAGLKSAFEAMGHIVSVAELKSGLHGIRITAKGLEGGADPRREGIVVSSRN